MSQPEYSQKTLEIAKLYRLEPARVDSVRKLPPSELKTLTEAYVQEENFDGPAKYALRGATDLIEPYLLEVFSRPDAFEKISESSSYSPAQKALLKLDEGMHPSLKPIFLHQVEVGGEGVWKQISEHLILSLTGMG